MSATVLLCLFNSPPVCFGQQRQIRCISVTPPSWDLLAGSDLALRCLGSASTPHHDAVTSWPSRASRRRLAPWPEAWRRAQHPALARLGRALWDLPQWAPTRPVQVVSVWSALSPPLAGGRAVCLTLMPWGGDWLAAAVPARWSPPWPHRHPQLRRHPGTMIASGFFHLAFSSAIGPPAILAMAIGESAGSAVRRRPGAFAPLQRRGSLARGHRRLAGVPTRRRGGVGGDRLALGGAGAAVAETIVNLSLLGGWSRWPANRRS